MVSKHVVLNLDNPPVADPPGQSASATRSAEACCLPLMRQDAVFIEQGSAQPRMNFHDDFFSSRNNLFALSSVGAARPRCARR